MADLIDRKADETPRSPAVAEKPAEVVLVKMKRDPTHWPAPHTADVHPNEVNNYRVGGWHEA